VKAHAFVAALAVLVVASGCGVSEPEYQQAGTADCLRERGFLVRVVGPLPTELTVFARHWTGTSHYRIGVLRFYASSAEAEQATRESSSPARGTHHNVLADDWIRAEDWRSCLTEA
jgi:hypothetical protein